MNRFVETAIVAEVKRNPQKIDMNVLSKKIQTLDRYLGNYKIELRGLSLKDM